MSGSLSGSCHPRARGFIDVVGTVVAAYVIASGALTGCATVRQIASGTLARPSADVTAVRLTNVTLSSADMSFDVAITNPLAVAVPLADVDFSLASRGSPFVEGVTAFDRSISAGATETVTLPVSLDYVELVRTLASVRPGHVVPYEASIALHLSLPGGQALRLPVSKSGELPIPQAPSVGVSSIRWDELSLTRARGVLALDITNTNAFPFDLSALDYGLSLGRNRIADGSASRQRAFEPGESAPLELPLEVSLASLGASALEMLAGGDAPYALDLGLTVGTPFGPMTWQFGSEGTAPITH